LSFVIFFLEGPDIQTRVVSFHAALNSDLTLNKRRAGKAEMDLIPRGSPRHEQTVAIALKTIIAQRFTAPTRETDKAGSKHITKVTRSGSLGCVCRGFYRGIHRAWFVKSP
jgi:hypothetical protein